tara:strand:- start:150 stop:710 length:561 start_codon:yes stop_codon:yes gene_type:complete
VHFDFTDDQDVIRDAARRFAHERLAPNYKAYDTQKTFSKELIHEMGELGLIGTSLPAEVGGLGQDYLTEGIVMEELAREDVNVGYILLLNTLNAGIIAEHGSREMAAEVLPEIFGGRKISCLALTEPSAGSDAANIRLKAERKGALFFLNSEKTSISMAHQTDTSASCSPSKARRRSALTAYRVSG